MRPVYFFCFQILFYLGFSQPAEVTLLSKIYADSSAGKDAAAKALSTSVAPVSFAVPASLLLTGIIKKDSALIEKGIKASVAFGLNAILTAGGKYFVDRRRPYTTYPKLFHPKDHAEDYSFPSGHTSFAFAGATSLVMSCPKWYVAVPAYAWACGAAWSRMQLGMHYPSDILMGALLGSASSYFSFKIEKCMNKKQITVPVTP